jgi:hypothetical protein
MQRDNETVSIHIPAGSVLEINPFLVPQNAEVLRVRKNPDADNLDEDKEQQSNQNL